MCSSKPKYCFRASSLWAVHSTVGVNRPFFSRVILFKTGLPTPVHMEPPTESPLQEAPQLQIRIIKSFQLYLEY